MAEVQQDNGGGKGKNHQKKMTIRVDFTPMVDMNMLLITFFMLCTTMIKSQTLNIALPSNEKVDNVENMSQASADDAVTIILDAKRKVGSMAVDTVNGKVVNDDDTETTSANSTTEFGSNVDTTEDYVNTIVGKNSGESFSEMLLKFRETFMNVDMLVLEHLEPLFMGVW